MTALHRNDFRLTAPSGFGDGWNHYAHSMAVFRGRVYVGTTRGSFAALKIGAPAPNLKPWPIDSPEDLYSINRRAEIWEYTPETGEWLRVYQAPEVVGTNGRRGVPSYIGFRGMSVFQGASDAEPCLYVSSWSPHLAHSPDVLRSENGRHFVPVPRPPFGPAVRACRTLQPFQGRLHLSPTASGSAKGFTQDIGSEALIYASDDTAQGLWAPVNEEGFGNPDNATIFEMEVYNQHLYAGTVNAASGGELWKTRGGERPYQWTKVFDRGAGRGLHNEVVGAMCEFKGALYVGSGIINGGYHRTHRIGPAAAELIRVWPDDSYDVIVGESRITEQGAKYPLSGYSAGFDNLFNGYIWRMVVHDGHLYAGTMSWACLLPYLPLERWPASIGGLVRQWGLERLSEQGGAQLWRTADGVHWEPVTRDGFGNKFNWGIRTFGSTPQGLLVGTANPFGPRVAVQRNGAWRYSDNPRGGCEVWLGHQGTEPSNG